MRIFTNEEKLKAIELFIQYDFSPGAVITQIGYPAHRSVVYDTLKVPRRGCGHNPGLKYSGGTLCIVQNKD